MEQHIPNLYNRDKNIIKKNATMAFYKEEEQLYLETDMLGVGLRASLLEMRDVMQFSRNEAPKQCSTAANSNISKSLASAEIHCRNIEKEALGILHSLEKITTIASHLREV